MNNPKPAAYYAAIRDIQQSGWEIIPNPYIPDGFIPSPLFTGAYITPWNDYLIPLIDNSWYLVGGEGLIYNA